MMRKIQLTILITFLIINIGRSQTLNIPDNIGTSSNTGNIGIRTNDPQAVLDVTTSGPMLLPNNTGSTNTAILRIGHSYHPWAGGQLDMGIYNSAAHAYPAWIQVRNPADYSINRNLLLNPNGGNVGIGITNPYSKLNINTGGNVSTGGITLQNGTTQQHFWYLAENTRSDFKIGSSHGEWSWTNSNGEMVRITSAGNVGIGVDNPTVKLQVDGDISAAKVMGFNIQDAFDVSGNSVAHYGMSSISGTGYKNVALSGYYGLEFYTWGQQRIKVLSNGNVGIGTEQPTARQEIHVTSGGGNVLRLNTSFINGNSVDLNPYITGVNNGGFEISIAGYQRFIINPDGSIGVGTTATGTHKLAVEGTIGAREIKVEASGWSDFVFENDYKLKDLEEVESFIEENKHLPDVPSEKEVLENGIQLGEMDAKLLQKIEELTLYTIQQEKEIKALKSLNKKFIELQLRLEKLELKD